MSDIDSLYSQMLMSRSGAQRVWMGADMYSAARAIVLASKPANQSAAEWLLRRFYGSEFDESEIRLILDRIGPSRQR